MQEQTNTIVLRDVASFRNLIRLCKHILYSSKARATRVAAEKKRQNSVKKSMTYGGRRRGASILTSVVEIGEHVQRVLHAFSAPEGTVATKGTKGGMQAFSFPCGNVIV
jgi:hypothetical protein